MLTSIDKIKCFDGFVETYSHPSSSTQTQMKFSVFTPESSIGKKDLPGLLWLSGLTCTHENFFIKSGACKEASKQGVSIICPDTSPRGIDLPGEHETYDLGSGAGFYMNTIQDPWKKHYQMESYIMEEIVEIFTTKFFISKKRLSLFGHSMGGHGALYLGIKYPEYFRSLSAFSPITSLTSCPWGRKALLSYIGEESEVWDQYDVVKMLSRIEKPLPILVDQGLADPYLKEQLKTDLLIDKVKEKNFEELCNIRLQEGYDHSYFFIASFIRDHLKFHTDHSKEL